MGKKTGTLEFVRFYFENSKAFKIYRIRNKSRTQLTLANVKISEIEPLSNMYWQRIREFNDAMIYHYRGKWYATEAMKNNNDKGLWEKTFKSFETALDISRQLNTYTKEKSNKSIDYEPPVLRKEAEILFSEDVPIVPDITPVIMLRGTSYEMGRQYAKQLVDIFGDWMLKRHAGKELSTEELKELYKWEEMHKTHTPEIIEFSKGWSDYALEIGITLTYENVIDLWVGHNPPATSYLNTNRGIPELPPLACTALAAWNTATDDGKLIAAATGDHDMSYQVTMVAYPDEGIPFIFTIFEATGTLPTVGPNWFFGHPSMNLKGLTYVHHGGGPKMLEPIDEWGYGIRRGASVMHNLRYKSSAKDAYKQEMKWPIGDIGFGDQATVGGFYADDGYAYIIEGRSNPKCVREAGILDEEDYLFSNNSVNHPDAIQSDWMNKIKDLWSWDKKGGWRPTNPTGMTKSLGMILKWYSGKMNTDELMSKGMMFAYWNSYNRNIFLDEMAKRNHGKITVDTAKAIYRTTGTLPREDWDKAVKEYRRNGQWGKISAAHSSNALVAVMKPSEGLYSLCTGPAIRGVKPISPDLAISIYNERNAFWDIKLTKSPELTLEHAKKLAIKLYGEVEELLNNQPFNDNVQSLKLQLDDEMSGINEQEKSQDIFVLSRELRSYTRIHVKARQIINLYHTPKRFVY